MGIETVLRHPGIFRARECTRGPAAGLASGFALWDRLLEGGWPGGQLIEGCGETFGGETRLLLPALAQITRQERQVALVTPPAHPWLPAWEALGVDRDRLLIVDAHRPPDRVWALEQLLQDASIGGVVAWLPQIDGVGLRRLRLACSESRAFCWILRPESALERPSAAHLRYAWLHDAHGLVVRVLKQAGRVGDSDWVRIDLSRIGGTETGTRLARSTRSNRVAPRSSEAARVSIAGIPGGKQSEVSGDVSGHSHEKSPGRFSEAFPNATPENVLGAASGDATWRRFHDFHLEGILQTSICEDSRTSSLDRIES